MNQTLTVQLHLGSSIIATRIEADYWLRGDDGHFMEFYSEAGVKIAEFRFAELLTIGVTPEENKRDADLVNEAINWYWHNQMKVPGAGELLSVLASIAWHMPLDEATEKVGEILGDLTVSND